MVVNNCFVVQLCCTNPQRVIGVGRCQQKSVIFEKSLYQRFIVNGCFTKNSLLWAIVTDPLKACGVSHHFAVA